MDHNLFKPSYSDDGGKWDQSKNTRSLKHKNRVNGRLRDLFNSDNPTHSTNKDSSNNTPKYSVKNTNYNHNNKNNSNTFTNLNQNHNRNHNQSSSSHQNSQHNLSDSKGNFKQWFLWHMWIKNTNFVDSNIKLTELVKNDVKESRDKWRLRKHTFNWFLNRRNPNK